MFKLFSGSIGTRLIGMAFTFFSGMMLAKELGAENFGIYSFVMALVSVLAIPSQSGFANLVIKEISPLKQNEDKHVISSIIKWIKKRNILFAFIITTFSIIILILIYISGAIPIVDNAPIVFLLGFISVLFLGSNVIGYSILKARKRLLLGQFIEACLYPISFFIFITTVSLFGWLNTESAMLIRLASLTVVFLTCVIFCKKYYSKKLSNELSLQEKSRLNKLIVSLSLSDGIRVLQANIPLVVMGIILFPQEVGVFKVAQSLLLFVGLPATVIATMMAPDIAKGYKQHDEFNLESKIRQYNKMYLGVMLITSVIVYFLSEYVIQITFGSDYLESGLMLIIMTFSMALSSCFGLSDLVMNMTERNDLVLKSSLISLVFSVTSAFLLVYCYGVWGGVASYCVSHLFYRAYLYTLAKKNYRFKIAII
ncbi:oligosaccharide flippase family protein [Vibrio pelagius]|uniref:oligosaccharide flippase family protein n=1 Tax=Vibrio pelagius TaxID=28169 RepID=UPI00355356F1